MSQCSESASEPPFAQRRVRLIERRPKLTALLVLLLSLSATVIVARVELLNARFKDNQHFDQLVERVQSEVTRRVSLYRYGLMGTRGAFAASSYVDRQEFSRLAGARELDSEFPGALGIGYIERIDNDAQAVASFVEQMRREGTTDFKITLPPGASLLPDSVSDDRFVTKYIEPVDVNRSALGLDIGSHPVRREAAERAMLVGDACLTGVIQLVQDSERVAGFLYLLPFYKPGMPIDTPEQRTEALAGWVYMPLLGPRVFEGVTESVWRELDLEVFDGRQLAADRMIYDVDGHLTQIDQDVYTDEHFTDRSLHTTREIEVGGRTWVLSLSTTGAFARASRSGFILIIVGGTALSLLLSSLIYLQGSSSRKAWALAEGMTADLREYAEKATHATEAKSAFLANMSHEIRTPMTAILGFTDLLRVQLDQDNRELISHTQTIRRNAEHLLSVINDVLDVSKIEAGKLAVEKINVRPDALVGDVLSLMRVKSDEKALPISGRMVSPVPAIVQTDPVRLRQILVNLVGNAIKFTDSGSVAVEMRYDAPMQLLKIAVVDTGPGMTEEQTSRLFAAFDQGDVTTARKFGGTGLGLHISYRLAKMLSGEIVCNTKPGQGSTFTLTLWTGPLEPLEMLPPGDIHALDESGLQDESAASTTAPETKEADADDRPLAGVKILMAEDGRDNQRLINHYLTKAGARVKIVENGRLAVEELCVKRDTNGPLHDPPPFDVLLTDIQMPEMDGYTAVRLLRRLGSTMPIVALTAHAMKEDINKCYSAGCDYYASKPIDKNKLIDVCLEAAEKNAQHA